MKYVVLYPNTVKGKFQKFVDGAKKKAVNVGKWIVDNKELVIVVAPMVIGLGTAVVKGVSKSVNMSKAKDLKELYCYDPSLGHYWNLKRKLTNAEALEIEARRKAGEKLGEILSSMNVLK